MTSYEMKTILDHIKNVQPKISGKEYNLTTKSGAEAFATHVLQVFTLNTRGWTFRWNRRKTAWGTCNYRTRTIELSTALYPVMSQSDVRETILHEVAHALTPGQGHGRYWRVAARAFGLTGKATTTASSVQREILTAKSRYALYCTRCNFTEARHRKTRAMHAPQLYFTCPHCNTRTIQLRQNH